MRLLILGGTVFLGRWVAGNALERGHEVTLFNRGRSNPGLFPGAEEVHGDRDGGLAPLEGRRFDAVIDTSGYVPRVVRQSAALLAGAAGHYAFVSSESAYATARGGAADPVVARAQRDDVRHRHQRIGIRAIARDVHAVVSGSGRILVRATNSLDAAVPGSGAIIYSGNPAHVTTSITGNGAVTAG